MRYQPINCLKKNAHKPAGWTAHQLSRVMKYYGRLRYLEHIPFEDFEWPKGVTSQKAGAST